MMGTKSSEENFAVETLRGAAPPLSYAQIVDAAIEANRANRQAHVGNRATLSRLSWAIEYCTVRLDVGRRAGATTYIRSYATERDAVVVSDPRLLGEYEGLGGLVVSAGGVSVVGNPTRAGERQGFRRVFVEHPSCVFRAVPHEKLYETLGLYRDTTFILLGT